MLIQTFYNGLTHEFQIYIDAASGGSLLTKNPTEAKELVEKMSANDNYHPGGRNNVKKGGKLDVDALTLLASSVQALSNKFDKLQTGSSANVLETCQMCNTQGHIAPNCPQNSNEVSIEEANAFYNSNPKRPYDPHSNTYNEGWKHHPNFSYKNTQAQQNPPPPPPRNNNYNPPGFQPRPPLVQQPMEPMHQPPQKSNLELMMEDFVNTTNNSIQQLQAQNKLMENQLSQLAHQVGQSSKTSGTFPGQTEHQKRGT
ncbi:component of gems protein 1-like [Chenopodium quinoa]|uniref:component of gems protein 1-like n=1 Tax=Chenopodium quinoa TaxID=63459 RepID=UPI000B798594|nr:component of gems protein 1-like [Chenopodium quinoa]